MATTTAAAIRDRIVTVIEGLVPSSLSSSRFLEHRNERDGDFEPWAEAHPTAALRRFRVWDTGAWEPPLVSSVDVEERTVTFSLLVAYPHSHRYGSANATDRLRVMDEDRQAIYKAIGPVGMANFSPPHPSACPIDVLPEDHIEGRAVDFVSFRCGFLYYRAL